MDYSTDAMRTDARAETAWTPRASSVPADFLLASPDRPIAALGVRRRLPAGSMDSLGDRVRDFFAKLPSDAAPRLLAGALPFDRQESDYLFQPQSLASPGLWSEAASTVRILSARPQPDLDAYKAAVRAALVRISDPRSPLTKVVLSRSLFLTADRVVDPALLAAKLGDDPMAARFVCPLPPRGESARSLVGATPELLVSRRGRKVMSQPLAGSTPRRANRTEDDHAAERLTGSEKDRLEHRLVVEAVLDSLAPYCAELVAPAGPHLMSTQAMWHLATRIEGRLRDPDTSSAELAAALHPTPAVCGAPRSEALSAIRALESATRGFYAGAVGWTQEDGDGDWYVSLRCAEIDGETIRLQAGAGIVAGSDPKAEADETSAKLMTMLRALGVDEQGRPAGRETAP